MGAIVAFYCESLLEQEYQLSAERIFLSACLPPEKFYENRIMFKTEEELYNYLRKAENTRSSYELSDFPEKYFRTV